MVETKSPEKAASLYLKAADVSLLEDKPRQTADLLGKAARLQVKIKMYDAAADTIQQEIDLQESSENGPAVGRLSVALVLVHLTRGDLIAAQKAYQNGLSTIDDDEAQTIETLLDAYDQEDGELAGRALSSPFLKHMDVEYAKLARNMTIPNTVITVGSSRLSDRQSSTASTESSSSLSTRVPSFEDTSSRLRNLSLDPPAAAAADDSENKGKADVDPEADDEYSGGLC